MLLLLDSIGFFFVGLICIVLFEEEEKFNINDGSQMLLGFGLIKLQFCIDKLTWIIYSLIIIQCNIIRTKMRFLKKNKQILHIDYLATNMIINKLP